MHQAMIQLPLRHFLQQFEATPQLNLFTNESILPKQSYPQSKLLGLKIN
ncbi:hypothetical protein VIBRN418_13196 [Vibrio sp. N418]|nr:hypothetical protein VIBRN418_13196 [Vibrio sp. N418]